MENSV